MWKEKLGNYFIDNGSLYRIYHSRNSVCFVLDMVLNSIGQEVA